jgi:hypothetical protein
VRFENMHNPQIPRVPRHPTQNVVFLDDVYDEKLIGQGNYYSPDEISEMVKMDGCKTSMHIFGEGNNDPNLQENVAQTRGFVNRPKNKGDFDKEKQKEKEKEKTNEKVSNEKVRDGSGTKRKQLSSNSTQMTYNVMEGLSKLRTTLYFIELVKIPQQRQNILKLFNDPSERDKVVITSPKQSQSPSTTKMRCKIFPFYISIENHDVALHNCLVEIGTTKNIMSLAVMEALGMSFTKYYETDESIYAIDSIKVSAYGEIKDFYDWITTAPYIIIVFNIIVVELPPAYGVVLGRDWTSIISGYIMNDGSCMILPCKEGVMIKVPHEPRKPFSFKNKDNELMENYIDVGIGNYVILYMEHNEILEKVKDSYNQEYLFEGYWRMSFDGACSKSKNGFFMHK